MKNELKGKIIKEYVAIRPKTYSYLTDDDKNVKKAQRTKKCEIKKRLLKYNIGEKRKILIVFDDNIPDMINNKN